MLVDLDWKILEGREPESVIGGDLIYEDLVKCTYYSRNKPKLLLHNLIPVNPNDAQLFVALTQQQGNLQLWKRKYYRRKLAPITRWGGRILQPICRVVRGAEWSTSYLQPNSLVPRYRVVQLPALCYRISKFTCDSLLMCFQQILEVF
eukprot:SAG11_NODE_10628_length_816_cov_0.783821_2_plen_147_part_01